MSISTVHGGAGGVEGGDGGSDGGEVGGDGGEGGEGGEGGDGARPTILLAVSCVPLRSALARVASVKSMVEVP